MWVKETYLCYFQGRNQTLVHYYSSSPYWTLALKMDLEEESERSDLEEFALQKKNPYNFRIRSFQILHWKDVTKEIFFFFSREHSFILLNFSQKEKDMFLP